MTYFVDTSFFFALASVNDPDHVRVRDVFDEFDPKQLPDVWLTTNHVVMETIRLTKRQVGHEAAVMNTSVLSPPQARARGLEFIPDAFIVYLEDGRSLSVPLEWFPRLRDATPEQRSHWRFIGPGTGIHWPDIDEDISVAGLLGLPD